MPITRGFTCPLCGRPLVVLKTRRGASGIVVRRRGCSRGHHRVTTYEREGAPVASGSDVPHGSESTDGEADEVVSDVGEDG